MAQGPCSKAVVAAACCSSQGVVTHSDERCGWRLFGTHSIETCRKIRGTLTVLLTSEPLCYAADVLKSGN